MEGLVQKKQSGSDSTLGWDDLDPIHPNRNLPSKLTHWTFMLREDWAFWWAACSRLLIAEMTTDLVTVILGHIHMLVGSPHRPRVAEPG